MPYLLLAFVTLLWGSSFLLIKIASQAFDWAGFAFGRAGIAAAALAIAALASGAPWPRSPRLWAKMTAMAVVGQFAPFLLLGYAARLITSADMALMMGAAPIFTFVMARLMSLGEVWNARAALGLALGFFGVAFALTAPTGAAAGVGSAAGLGRALCLLAALGYSGSALLSRSVAREIGATMTAAGSMTVSAALSFALVLVVDGSPSPSALAAKPVAALAALAALGLFNTALAYFVYFRLIALAGATFAALNNYGVPFLGLIAGALALGEPVAAASWLGLACVLGGVVVTGTAANAARVIVDRGGVIAPDSGAVAPAANGDGDRGQPRQAPGSQA